MPDDYVAAKLPALNIPSSEVAFKIGVKNLFSVPQINNNSEPYIKTIKGKGTGD
jgi:hypothetical protein